MKLIAEQWISDYLPQGAQFEIPDTDAATLIEAGLARQDVSSDAPPVDPPSRRQYRRRDLTADPE